MDFQNREGSKFGGGGIASASDLAADRRERQFRLGMEAFDINKDPYVVRNNVGQFVCKLCLTLHRNLPSYIGHTQVSRRPHPSHVRGKVADPSLLRRADGTRRTSGNAP
jgi:splicing factor 3A subunit 2